MQDTGWVLAESPPPGDCPPSVSALIRPPLSVLPTPAVPECDDVEYVAEFAKGTTKAELP